MTGRHQAPGPGPDGWVTPARVRFGLTQAAGAVISAVAVAVLGFLWQAVKEAGDQVDRLTNEIRSRPTAATSAQVDQLTRAVQAIPTLIPTPAPARVVVQPAGPTGVAVTVLPAPAQARPTNTDAPLAVTPKKPTPSPSPSATPANRPGGLLGGLLGPP